MEAHGGSSLDFPCLCWPFASSRIFGALVHRSISVLWRRHGTLGRGILSAWIFALNESARCAKRHAHTYIHTYAHALTSGFNCILSLSYTHALTNGFICILSLTNAAAAMSTCTRQVELQSNPTPQWGRSIHVSPQ